MNEAQRRRLEYLTTKPTITVDEFNEMETLRWGSPVPHLSLHEAVQMARVAQPPLSSYPGFAKMDRDPRDSDPSEE